MAAPFPSDPKAIPKGKPVKEQLRESELRTHAFWDSSPNLIFIKDKELRYLYVKREFERALRVNREQIRGKRDHEVFPPEQASAYQANDHAVLNAGVPIGVPSLRERREGIPLLVEYFIDRYPFHPWAMVLTVFHSL